MKLLEAGVIYAISDNRWFSFVHVVLKKGGITVITNEKNKLIPTRTVTGHRLCIDFRKLNAATRKDHFPRCTFLQSRFFLRFKYILGPTINNWIILVIHILTTLLPLILLKLVISAGISSKIISISCVNNFFLHQI